MFGHKDDPQHLKSHPKIVVISYTMLNRLQHSIRKLKWAIMIIDEAHHIRCSKKKMEPKEVNLLFLLVYSYANMAVTLLVA